VLFSSSFFSLLFPCEITSHFLDRGEIVAECSELGLFIASKEELGTRLPPSLVAELPFTALVDIAQLSDHISLLSRKIVILLKRKTDYYALFSTASQRINDLNKEMVALKSGFEAELDRKAALIAASETEIATAKTVMAAFKSEFENERLKKDSDLKLLKTEIDENGLKSTKRFDEFNSRFEEHKHSFADLSDKFSKLLSEFGISRTEHALLQSEVKVFKTEISKLLSDTAKGLESKSKADFTTLNAKLDGLEKALPGKVKDEVDQATLIMQGSLTLLQKRSQELAHNVHVNSESIVKINHRLKAMPVLSILRPFPSLPSPLHSGLLLLSSSH